MKNLLLPDFELQKSIYVLDMKLAIDTRYRNLAEFLEYACVEKQENGKYLRQFSAVLICGFVERSVEIIVLERLKKKAHPRVIKFVKSHFKKGTNYKCTAIYDLLQRFDEQWASKFKAWMEANPQSVDGVSSIYEVRNSAAHGGTQSIGSVKLQEYALSCHAVVEAIIVSTK